MLLSNSAIDRLLRHKQRTAFAFLENPPKTVIKHAVRRRGCGKCGKRTRHAPEESVDYNKIKQQIANLPPEKRNQIKSMLNCSALIVQYRSDKNRFCKCIF